MRISCYCVLLLLLSVCLTSASLLPIRFIHAVSDGMGGGREARGRDREGQERGIRV